MSMALNSETAAQPDVIQRSPGVDSMQTRLGCLQGEMALGQGAPGG